MTQKVASNTICFVTTSNTLGFMSSSYSTVSRGSIEFQNQNLRHFSPGIHDAWTFKQTNKTEWIILLTERIIPLPERIILLTELIILLTEWIIPLPERIILLTQRIILLTERIILLNERIILLTQRQISSWL